MFARCARSDPACIIALAAGSATSTCTVWPSWTSVRPGRSDSFSAPLAPLMVTVSPSTVAVTPWGSVTGFFATRDMF